MNRELFFRACRAASELTKARELTVFGSSAVIPWITGVDPSEELWLTSDVDIDPGSQEKADQIDGVVGEGSSFHATYGVYVQGVLLEAFHAPSDWRDRAKKFGVPESNAKILVPHPLDLVVSKLVAGRPHDWDFAVFCIARFAIELDRIEAGLSSVAAERPDLAPAVTKALSLSRSRLGSA